MTSNGVTTNYTYDAWGRLATRSKVIGGTTYTATYMWRYGDKLKRIDSNIPGELAMVRYDYNGLGKRMWRDTTNGDYMWWRWDLGWNVVAEYDDPDNDRVFEGFSKMFVPYGHSALAEAAVTTTPANAAYSYLAQDHLGTGRFVYNQSKTQTGAFEHYPYGARYSASGTAPYHEFTGKPWDADASLYYFPYRYYRPDMERWTSPDPLGLVDGPNVYGYVKNRPVDLIDIHGLKKYDAVCKAKCDNEKADCLGRNGTWLDTQFAIINEHFAACTAGAAASCAIGCAALTVAYFPCLSACIVSTGVICGLFREDEKRYAQETKAVMDENCRMNYKNCLRTCEICED